MKTKVLSRDVSLNVCGVNRGTVKSTTIKRVVWEVKRNPEIE